jgi:mannose-6-phosphate isomerase-like protein (cupin superfamily)
MLPEAIQSAEVIVPCTDLATSLAFFTEHLGFRVDLIFPADSPTTAVISAFGVRLRLEQSATALPFHLRLCADLSRLDIPRNLIGPDGVVVTFVDAEPQMLVPPGTQEWIVSRNNDAHAWTVGRAGMHYRDLIPGRMGGRFVASHIRIPAGGAVADYVHFHRVRFQMIYCKAGWVRVVYEDQGPPFVMQAGDCVLQPPQIRHRVLESSAGLEVIEIGCPAVHDTVADHNMTLPTAHVNADRDFAGQRFTHHIAAKARWQNINDFDICDLGIAAATNGMARVSALRTTRGAEMTHDAHAHELVFYFVLSGAIAINGAAFGEENLVENDSCVVPPGTPHTINAASGTQLLAVTI